MTDMQRDTTGSAVDRPAAGPSPAETARRHPPPPAPGRPGSYQTGGIRLALLVGSVVAVGVLFGWPLVVMILSVATSVFLHELGHYLTARWSGMQVTEFFIGAGPKIWSFRRGEVEYGVKLIPVLAYVRITGMSNLEEVDPADEPRSYRQQSFPRRLLVVSAGSLSHVVQAFVIGIVLFGVVGMPGGSLTDPRVDGFDVDDIVDGSAAEAAGFAVGDRIVAVDGRSVAGTERLSDALSTFDVGDEVAFTVERGGDEIVLEATLRGRPAGQGGDPGSPFLGVEAPPHTSAEPMGVGRAVVETPGEMWRTTTASLAGLGRAFSPSGLGDLADSVANATDEGHPTDDSSAGSPEARGGGSASGGRESELVSIIGVVHLGSQDTEHRAALMLAMLFQLNLVLGAVNMLPLPPLDGGHAALAVYERIRSRRGQRYHADFAKLLPLTYAVFLVLMVVGVTTMYLDIVNPIEL